VRFCGSILFIEILHDHPFNLASGLCSTLNCSQNRQFTKFTGLLQNGRRRRDYGRVPRWASRHLSTLSPGSCGPALT
jgi:hypothetical protein